MSIPSSCCTCAVGADPDVVQERRLGAEVAERDELTGDRTHLGMRGHRRGERPAEVLVADRVQFGVDLPGPVPFFQAEDLLVVRDDVGVARCRGSCLPSTPSDRRRSGSVMFGVCTNRLRYHSALPAGETYSVHHAVAEEPVVGRSRGRVRPRAEVDRPRVRTESCRRRAGRRRFVRRTRAPSCHGDAKVDRLRCRVERGHVTNVTPTGAQIYHE